MCMASFWVELSDMLEVDDFVSTVTCLGSRDMEMRAQSREDRIGTMEGWIAVDVFLVCGGMLNVVLPGKGQNLIDGYEKRFWSILCIRCANLGVYVGRCIPG